MTPRRKRGLSSSDGPMEPVAPATKATMSSSTCSTLHVLPLPGLSEVLLLPHRDIVQGSNLGVQVWVLATYLFLTGIKRTSSMRLHRNSGITQKTAWHLAHRIRDPWNERAAGFTGPVEVDKTYPGDEEQNKLASQKTGPSGETAVVEMPNRDTNAATAQTVGRPTLPRLRHEPPRGRCTHLYGRSCGLPRPAQSRGRPPQWQAALDG